MKGESIGYSSVAGSLHAERKLSNQDAYLVKRYSFGTLLVVSDGMGSHKHSDVGSRSVCRAVSKAVQIWEASGCKEIRLIIPVIHSLWGLEIYPYPRNECGATCLFAFVSKVRKRLYMGQLGDGAVYFRIDGAMRLLKSKEDAFANLTTGINSIRSFEDWSLAEYDICDKRVALLLMTDGVSETLVESRKEEFVELIWKRLSEKRNLAERNMTVCSILSKWNKVSAGDDRTLVSYERV